MAAGWKQSTAEIEQWVEMLIVSLFMTICCIQLYFSYKTVCQFCCSSWYYKSAQVAD